MARLNKEQRERRDRLVKKFYELLPDAETQVHAYQLAEKWIKIQEKKGRVFKSYSTFHQYLTYLIDYQ